MLKESKIMKGMERMILISLSSISNSRRLASNPLGRVTTNVTPKMIQSSPPMNAVQKDIYSVCFVLRQIHPESNKHWANMF